MTVYIKYLNAFVDTIENVLNVKIQGDDICIECMINGSYGTQIKKFQKVYVKDIYIDCHDQLKYR